MTVYLVFDLFETELDREQNSGSIDGGIAYQYDQQLITPPPPPPPAHQVKHSM